MNTESDREQRFRVAYAAHARALLAFAARRCDNLPDAADVVADTMLVAWRRVDAMPAEPETRLWLFGVARNVIHNHRRGHRRRRRLGERLREQLREHGALQPEGDDLTDTAHATDLADTVRSALARLKPVEREVILLTIGERLTPTEIAVVLQLNPSTVRTHLQRARTKLRNQLEVDTTHTDRRLRRDDVDGHERVEAHPAPRSHGPEEISQ